MGLGVGCQGVVSRVECHVMTEWSVAEPWTACYGHDGGCMCITPARQALLLYAWMHGCRVECDPGASGWCRVGNACSKVGNVQA